MLHLGDITKIHGAGVPAVEVVIGGSPCQDLSVAGKRAGLDGERSGLFMDQIRVIKEMRDYDKRVNARTGPDVRPRYMVWENVPGAFSSAGGEDFRAVLEETAHIAEKDAVIPRPENGKWQTAGCIMGDGWSIAWRILDAQFWGVPQRRRRIALVADFGGDTAPEILFERESVSGDSQESGTAGEGTAGDAENGVGKAVSFVNRGHFRTDGVSETLRSECHHDVPCVAIGFKPRQSEKARSLGCEVEKAPSLETSQNAAICMATQQGGAEIAVDLCPTITASAGMSGNNQPCVVYNEETITSKTNASNPAVGDPCHTLGATGAGRAICIQGNCIDRADTAGCNGKGWRDDDVSFTLNTIDRPAVYAIDNHPQDSRVTVRDDGVVQTLSKQCGTGGGNVPMCMSVCIGNGQADIAAHITEEVAQTLNCMHDQMAVMTYQQTTGPLMANSYPGSYTGQDAYNDMLVAKALHASGNDPQQEDRGTYPITRNLVRRLTPLECERLQGYPDGWTDIGEWVDSKGKKHQSSDSARYKALGNSIALPPWRFVLGRLNAYLAEHTMASLFDGIGGFPLIWRELNGDGKCLWASEIEEFPIAVTRRRFND